MYADLKKEELLDELRSRGMASTELTRTNKPELVELLETLDMEEKEVDQTLNDVVEEEDRVVQEDLTTEELDHLQIEAVPHIFDDRWSEFIMGQFEEDEMDGDSPKCAGCRRIVQKFIGPIIRCGVAAHTPPCIDNHGTATVVYQIEVQVTNEDHPVFHTPNGTLFYEDIADVNTDNTDAPFSKHPSATAATRAEGRIYRKMLNLRNVITAEEASDRVEEEGDIDWTPDDPINEDQIAVLNMICSRVDLDVVGFINSGRQKYADITQVPRRTATKMIKELNNFQQGSKPKPPAVPTYNPDWRTNA